VGFFDADKRLAALSAKGDPLEAIDRLVPWESFRADIEAVVLTPEEMRKSAGSTSAARTSVSAQMRLPLSRSRNQRADGDGCVGARDADIARRRAQGCNN